MGELHLQVIIDRLKREFGLDTVTGNPQVAYRETITTEADGVATYVGYSGGRGDSARVRIRLSPLESGAGYVFANRVEGAAPEVSRAVDEGVRAEAMNGSLADAPVDDLRVELCEVSPVESGGSEAAFRAAGAMAFRDGYVDVKDDRLCRRASRPHGRSRYALVARGWIPKTEAMTLPPHGSG
jgi:elongation factor G